MSDFEPVGEMEIEKKKWSGKTRQEVDAMSEEEYKTWMANNYSGAKRAAQEGKIDIEEIRKTEANKHKRLKDPRRPLPPGRVGEVRLWDAAKKELGKLLAKQW